MVKILLLLIVLVNGLFAFRFFTDFMKHKREAWAEPGNNVLLAVWGAVCFFFSTFGISDFALSTVLYRARKLVDDAKLPGTLNTQCAIPVAVMALAYISSIDVDQMTLVLLIVFTDDRRLLWPPFCRQDACKAHKDVHGSRACSCGILRRCRQVWAASLGR